MSAARDVIPRTFESGQPAGARSYVSAMLNILEDSAAEKAQLADAQRAVLNILADAEGEKLRLQATQKAILNILDDSAEEKARLGDTQRAVLNILEDFAHEKSRLDTTQRAILNILEDSAAERVRLADTQRAVLNILEDAEGEKLQLQATQKAILNILDDSADEKSRLADTQRAVLNILEDIELEKKKVEQVNVNLRKEIGERLRAEEELRRARVSVEDANKELEAFNYSVSHDLRAPLRSIDGFSLALLEEYTDRLDAEGARYLRNVRSAAQQMGRLIEGLLNLSRVTKTELHREPVSLTELAHTVLGRLRGADPSRTVEYSVQADLAAQGDPRLLDVVLTNLLGNAWKFTGKRELARIEFGAIEGSRPAVFFVRDNGAGFDAAYTAQLFGVFQRLHTTKEFEGTGIGLATVQRIVRRHGGRVWAEGYVDRGATFYFTLEGDRT
jgi:signal transduction histidine kinase